MIHWIQQYIEVDFARNFVRVEDHFLENFDRLPELVKAYNYPIIVQSFNRFNLYYMDTLYLTNSLSRATLLFFAFVMKNHEGKILNTPIDGLQLQARDMRHFWAN
jgi:hypothetical protein